jgi:hypothetical protein
MYNNLVEDWVLYIKLYSRIFFQSRIFLVKTGMNPGLEDRYSDLSAAPDEVRFIDDNLIYRFS